MRAAVVRPVPADVLDRLLDREGHGPIRRAARTRLVETLRCLALSAAWKASSRQREARSRTRTSPSPTASSALGSCARCAVRRSGAAGARAPACGVQFRSLKLVVGDEREWRIMQSCLSRMLLSSHRPLARVNTDDPPRRADVTDGRARLAGGAVRGAPDPPARRRLPDARLAERGRRRRPGGLAPAQPRRRRRGREPRRLADDRRRAGLPEHAALAPVAARGAARRAHARADRRPRRRHRSRARGAARRLGRPGAARGARDAGPGRAARVRAARHVRGAVRRDRADRRPLARRRRGSSPAAPGAASRASAPCPTPTSTASGRSSTPSSRPRATATSRRCVAVLDPDVVLRADRGAVALGAASVVRGAENVAAAGVRASRSSASRCGPRSSTAPSARSSLRDGQPFRSLASRSAAGRIVEIDILADPESSPGST